MNNNVYICSDYQESYAFFTLNNIESNLKSATIIQYTIKGRFMNR